MTTLWPHQQAAHDKLAPLGRGMLAMGTGTGKSLTAIELIRTWGCRRVLILCPKAMVQVWPRELRKHGCDWRTVPLQKGTVPKRAQQLEAAALCSFVDGTGLAVSLNYAACLSPVMQAALLAVDWDCILLDESQNIKGHEGKVSRFVAELAARVEHVLGLTGTVLHDTPMDAFGQYRAIDPRLFGTDYFAFCRCYGKTALDDVREKLPDTLKSAARQAQGLQSALGGKLPDAASGLVERFGRPFVEAFMDGKQVAPDQASRIVEAAGKRYISWRLRKAPFLRAQVVGYQNLGDLRRRMETNTYVADKAAVLSLPRTLHEDLIVSLESKARKAYDGYAGASDEEVNALAKCTRLAQIANGFLPEVTPVLDAEGQPVLDETGEPRVNETILELGTEKRDALQELLTGLPPDEPVAVFGRFHHDLDEIHAAAAAAGRTSCELSGRKHALLEWQAGEFNVIAAELKSGGAGVDFTRACYQVYFAHPWSLGDYEQSLGRMDRPGQTRPVTYIHIVAAETIDEAVVEALQEKREIVLSVLAGLGKRRAAA